MASLTTTEKMRDALKINENGDISFNSTGNPMLDVLFMSEYYTNHLGEVKNKVGDDPKWRLFSMFMRDPRYGLGRRDLGRELMALTGVELEDVVKAGRYDDIFLFNGWMEFLEKEIKGGNNLAKKWAPRYSTKNLKYARQFARYLHLNKQQYGKFVKVETVESDLTERATDRIKFEHVPSLAMLKYYNRFSKGSDTKERFQEYLSDVANGVKDLKVKTSTVYDIYRNRHKIDPDLFFGKVEKVSVNCIPVVDTSGSMRDDVDSMGKAISIGHYLAKCSSFMPNYVVSFSSHPYLIELGDSQLDASQYIREVNSIYTGDCSNTDLVKVMELFERFEKLPDYIVVLTDGEFDDGSFRKKESLKRIWRERGYKTKFIWWNFNPRNTTVPEMDDCGNIYLSGYNPMLLKYLESGFDADEFLNKLLGEYAKKVFLNGN